MQTILGDGGPIADELARELRERFTPDIRLVSRNPKKVNDADELVSADLTDAASTSRAATSRTSPSGCRWIRRCGRRSSRR